VALAAGWLAMATCAAAADPDECSYTAPVCPDPAVPLIQLPADFKTYRVSTDSMIKAGGSVDILNVRGPGAVRHIWQIWGQGQEIEICVDGAKVPQVRMPTGPFYGIMHDLEPYVINSAPFVVLPNKLAVLPGKPGYNCYLPIPFSKSCRITLHAASAKEAIARTNWHSKSGWIISKDESRCQMEAIAAVDWHQYKDGTPITPFRLHAEHNLEKPAVRQNDFRMLDAEGRGFVAGLFMGVIQKDHTDMVFHNGGMSILIDGESDPHAIKGFNMEDDYGFTWGFNDRQAQWIGCPWHENRGRNEQDGVFYRFFGPDPIAFHASIAFSTGCRADDTESVVYYYRVLGSAAPKILSPKQWQIAGYFPGGNNWATFQRSEFVEHVPPGTWPEVLGVGKAAVQVRTLESRHTWIPLCHVSARRLNQSVYARSSIDSDRDKAAVLRIAIDDWAIIWLNGDKIATLRHEQDLETARIPIRLKQGQNELRIKSTNSAINRELWAMSCVVEDAATGK
jgi:hypothetical protein